MLKRTPRKRNKLAKSRTKSLSKAKRNLDKCLKTIRPFVKKAKQQQAALPVRWEETTSATIELP